MSGHGIGWAQLREVRATSLCIGDVFVRPGAGAAYWTAPGGAVRGVGWSQPDGTAWTVLGRDGDRITARSHDGETASERIPVGAYVLWVAS